MAQAESSQVAIFRVGTELFALDIRHIREITRMEKITHVPSMPAFVEGVMELRGQILPVVDLRKRLEADTSQTRQTRIVITRLENRPLGLVVDEVRDVWEIQSSDVSETPSIGNAFRPAFLQGVLRRHDKIVFLLNFGELLSSTERASVGSINPDRGRGAKG